MLSMTDCLKSRYLFHKAVMDAGFTTGQAVIAAAVLFGPVADDDDDRWELGPEPATAGEDVEIDAPDDEWAPSPEDEADYREWAAELDRRWQDARVEADGHVSDLDIVISQGGAG